MFCKREALSQIPHSFFTIKKHREDNVQLMGMRNNAYECLDMEEKEVEGEDGDEDEDEGIRSRILPLFTR
jgi:hypothetical protein